MATPSEMWADEIDRDLADLQTAVIELVSINRWLLSYLKRTGNAQDIRGLQHRLDIITDLLAEEGVAF